MREVPVPAESLVAGAFPRASYADAYAIYLPVGETPDVDALTRLLTTSAPRWAEQLMWLRDRIVTPLGLRTARTRTTSRDPASRLQPGDMAGMFRVFERSDDEILLGGEDSHLDFRVSVLVLRSAVRSSAVLTTAVRFNNGLGRAYFFVVRPFHRLIVTSMLRNLVGRVRE